MIESRWMNSIMIECGSGVNEWMNEWSIFGYRMTQWEFY